MPETVLAAVTFTRWMLSKSIFENMILVQESVSVCCVSPKQISIWQKALDRFRFNGIFCTNMFGACAFVRMHFLIKSSSLCTLRYLQHCLRLPQIQMLNIQLMSICSKLKHLSKAHPNLLVCVRACVCVSVCQRSLPSSNNRIRMLHVA